MEDSSAFTMPGYRMDVVVAPQGMALASDEEFAVKGVLLDLTVHCPTAPTYVRRAAREVGFVCNQAERTKYRWYGKAGVFDPDRFILVPFALETFGRLGRRAIHFVHMLASHSAARRGGNEGVVKRRMAAFSRQIFMEFSLSLAREQAERQLTYVRGAAMMGRTVRPVSPLLALSPAADARV
jgi:hypothetical protein